MVGESHNSSPICLYDFPCLIRAIAVKRFTIFSFSYELKRESRAALNSGFLMFPIISDQAWRDQSFLDLNLFIFSIYK